MDTSYRIKNTRLRWREKLNNSMSRQIMRLSRMLILNPYKSLRRGFLKVMLGITYRCQCKCLYCCSGNYPVNEKNELKTQEIFEVLKQITDFPSLSTVLSFFGGEPLLREDLYYLIEYANKKGLFTEVESNGILLTRENVKKLKKGGLHHIFVRIESSKSGIHDALSNYEGCFERAIEGIKNCIGKKLACTISTIALKEKIYNDDLRTIIGLGKKLGVTSVRILYPTLAGNWINERAQILNDAEKAKVGDLLEPDFVYLESTYSANKDIGRICPSLQKKFLYISPYGEVRPCPFVSINFGNLRDHNVKKTILTMWENKIFQERNCFLCNQ